MEIKEGSYSYNTKVVFTGINLKLNDGDIVALVGTNGSGKTTLLKCLAGQLKLTSGEILSNESDNPIYVPDVPTAYEYLTGYEYLLFIQKILNTNDKEKLVETLKLYTLYEEKDKLIKYYSHGMKQKLSLCAALVNDSSRYILLDEPLTGVDEKSREVIIENLKKLSLAGKTILLSTHQIDIMKEVCNRIFYIDQKKEEVLHV